VLAAVAVLSLLFVIGCPQGTKTAELEAQVQQQQETITGMETQIQTLTAERDSLMKVITEMQAKGGTQKTPGTGGSTGGTQPPPGKPPRTGR